MLKMKYLKIIYSGLAHITPALMRGQYFNSINIIKQYLKIWFLSVFK